MKLTNFSQRNLDVINNFLLYANLNDPLHEQLAISYISEDHVDGEQSPQALLERALSSEHISVDILMGDDEIPCDAYWDDLRQLIYVVDTNHNLSIYRLTKDLETLKSEHRDEILSYSLSKVTPDDEVGISDIILHCGYIELVNTIANIR